ncbi:MAG TPA: sigma-70 family RNA polymerase sigma factor [Saprospiraceae bacterium]|nr:sigma-70 family RNA polymerase sigma factor [Saprospiraceae bacterium]HPI06228.1 sigma-70 family RNA polymerase sigma factor [Saprospiraceae bacterium]
MSDYPNEWYLEGLRDRKDETIKTIFEEFLPRIAVYIRQNQGTNEDANDVFQDALVAIFRKTDTLVLKASFYTFLYAVCRNIWLNKLRRKKFTGEVTEQEFAVLREQQEIEPAVEEAERYDLLYKNFDHLPPDCRKLLLLCWHSGKGMEEIAAEMEITYAYARKRRHVCTGKLIVSIKSDPLYQELKR